MLHASASGDQTKFRSKKTGLKRFNKKKNIGSNKIPGSPTIAQSAQIVLKTYMFGSIPLQHMNEFKKGFL